MARPAFRFSLEPELVRRGAEREGLEREVLQGRAAVDQAQERLEQARGVLGEVVQQRWARSDELFAPSAGAVLDPLVLQARGQHLAELELLERRRREEVAGRERECAEARDRLARARSALAECEARIEALERVRERELASFEREQEKRAAEARDDDAQLRWNHERRERER